MIRLRGNTKHTQRNGWEPADITVEITTESREEYVPGTIEGWTLRIHEELKDACEQMNEPTPDQKQNPFTSIKPS